MFLATNAGPFELREVSVTAAELPSLRLLHISDIHFAPGQRNKAAFLQELAQTKPDLVVNTGDNLGHKLSINPLLDAIEPLLGFPGVFVNGSNDYFAPKLKNPARYLVGPSKQDSEPAQLDTERLTREFEGAGWQNLNNRSASIRMGDAEVSFAGLDDPHIGRDEPKILEKQTAQIGVVHAPYLKSLEALTTTGAKLLFAGHTHGGQLCLPGGKALVTNCDLPTAQASGLSEYGGAKLHVSAGLGCSIYAPLRLFCPPSATLVSVN